VDPGGAVRPLRLVLPVLLLAGCGLFEGSPKVRKGSVVKIHYILEVDGRKVDSTYEREPIEFRPGRGRLIEGLEEGVLGLKAGEEKTITLTPDKGYGMPDRQAVQKVPLERFGAQVWKLKPGASVQGRRHGRLVTARVLAVDGKDATLDFNHPYAGKILTFKVKVVEVASARSARRRS
jgi:FKBP-type peptidyl-prolyl cis-trans isomerase 2